MIWLALEQNYMTFLLHIVCLANFVSLRTVHIIELIQAVILVLHVINVSYRLRILKLGNKLVSLVSYELKN